MRRSLVFSILILMALNLSLCSGAALAGNESDRVRLKSNLQQLLLEKRDLEKALVQDLDKITDQINRLERVKDINAVSRALDDLHKMKREQERKQQDIFLDIRDVENALRSCDQLT
jgi:hypothetical protein